MSVSALPAKRTEVANTAAVAAGIAALFALSWAASGAEEHAEYVICSLAAVALCLARLSWGFAGLLLLYMFELASVGYGLTSPARTTGVVVGLMALPAIGWRLRQDGWTRARPSWWTLFLVAFLVCGFATVVLAPDRRAWAEAFARLALLAALSITGYACIQSWRDLRIVCWVVFFGMVAAALIAIAQYVFRITVPGVHVWRYYGAIRTTGLTTRPHSFAFMLVSAAGYGLALLISASSRRAQVTAAGGTLAIVAALFSTMVRSSIAFGLGLLLACHAFRFRPRTRRGQAVILAAAVTAGALLLVVMPAPVRTRLLATRKPGEQSVSARSRTTTTGLAIALHNPLGVGLGNAESYYDIYRAPDDPGRRLASHCTYLEIAGTTGWAGLTFFLAIILATHLRMKAAETALVTSGRVREARLLMGLRFILYAFLGQACFWHQILTDKLIWATLGVMHAGAALGRSAAPVQGLAERGR